MDPFYRTLDEDRFESTPATAGPWSPDAQHAGPPSALLARAMELHEPRENTRLADVRTDILGPIPVAPLTVSVRTLRGGRSMELLEAQALTDDGRPAITARAWRIVRAPEDFPPLAETIDDGVEGPPEDTAEESVSPKDVDEPDDGPTTTGSIPVVGGRRRGRRGTRRAGTRRAPKKRRADSKGESRDDAESTDDEREG